MFFSHDPSSQDMTSLFLILQLTAKEMADLWMEYEENTSLEAKVVKDFDKVCYDQ